jgi:AraC family transcriptional regulator of adaptative response / DNA-3-methyladenine glycosylase II
MTGHGTSPPSADKSARGVGSPDLPEHVCHRAIEARDPRFDGTFFVGITTTRIYCRPVCPSRPADPGHRRFFVSAPAAEQAGFRPCLRCRPELAPGRALVDAVSRLAAAAAQRIGAGALNGQPVASLASDLFVSERHLRRALKRELGVSPVELAQTHRLLLAKRLLADTTLDVSRVASASGFQSLRRFNAVFRDRYRMSPTALRRTSRSAGQPAGGTRGAELEPSGEPLRLTLSYRPPFAWDRVLTLLRRDALPGVEIFDGNRYGRAVRVDGHGGVVFAEDVPARRELTLEISTSLVPALMPLLARLRRLFDLDAEPAVVDAHLEEGGLARLVRRRPGMRIPGAFDGFEVAMATLLLGVAPHGRPAPPWRRRTKDRDLVHGVVEALGEPLKTGTHGLVRLAPGPERVADAGARGLGALGVPERRATAIADLAARVARGELRLDPEGDVAETYGALIDLPWVGERLATVVAMRVLHWPDAFPASDRALQRAAGVQGAATLRARAEEWRPWRAYAALHLWADFYDT